MLPAVRGLIETDDGAEVVFDLTGRTVWVDRDGVSSGRQLLLCLFESVDATCLWLNNTVCIVEGATSHLVVCRAGLRWLGRHTETVLARWASLGL
jgi:hypothetical protein